MARGLTRMGDGTLRRLAWASATATLGVCLPAAAAWESQLFPKNGSTGQYQAAPVSFGGRNWKLLDYSYAGYRLGVDALANGIPCASASIAGTGDITDELQAAVNTVGDAGGGTVIIPAGHFTVSRSIGVPFDDVSIVGAGSGQTFLSIPATYTVSSETGEGVFTLGKAVGGSNRGWLDRGNTLAMVSGIVNEGDIGVDVQDASGVAIGAWVVITQYYWPAFSQRNSGGSWPSYTGFPAASSASSYSSFAFLRKVLGKTGNHLTLDAPMPWKLDPANNPVGLRDAENPVWVRAHSNLGVAGVSIEFADNHNAGGHRPAGTGVHMEGVRDGWIYDVQVRHFPHFGMHLDRTARVTILDSAVYEAQDYGGGGFGFGIYVEDSQNVLVRSSRVEDARHGFTSRSSLTSMLVYSDDESAAARLSDDTHFAMSQAVLWDAHRPTFGTGVQGYYRGTQSSGAHETVGSAVYWNVQGDGYRGSAWGGSLQLNPSSDGWAIAVGPTGLEAFDLGVALGTNEERIGAAAGLQLPTGHDTAGPGSRDQNVLYEGVGQPGLAPASLYATQLANRLGTPPGDFSTTCRAAPIRGAVTPATYTGSGTLVFDSDHLGFMPGVDPSCAGCDIDSTQRNRTAGGRESLALRMNGTDFAIGADFRGATLSTGAFQWLRLAVYPTQSTLQFRVGLSQQDLPEGTYASRGDVVISGLRAGEWNRVMIPMASYTGSFNSVELRSTGAHSTSPLYVDDIVLEPSAPPPAACGDGIDNDGDGKTDYPDDPGCSSVDDDDESEPAVAPASGGGAFGNPLLGVLLGLALLGRLTSASGRRPR